MKFYLAGPMTGYEELNYPAFREAAKTLRAVGHEVVSPAEGFPPDPDLPLRFCLRADLDILLDPRTEAICVLPGWEKSRGAAAEVTVALACRMGVYRYPDLKPLLLETAIVEVTP